MKPTAQQLKDEIEKGPLSESLATPWSNVFPTEQDPRLVSAHPVQQRWERIKFRFGLLTPDAIFDIEKILNDPSLRSKKFPMAVATFAKFLAGRGLLRKIKAAVTDPAVPDRIKDICDLVDTLTKSAPDRTIDPNLPEEAGMIAAMIASGLATAQDGAAFNVAVSAPCSRLAELGWQINADLLQQAKQIQ